MLNLPVVLTDEALLQLTEISGAKNYQEVRRALQALEYMNEAFGVYDPGYEAARLSFSCRVCFAGDYGIYYIIAEDKVIVFSILDNRLDPTKRFEEIDDIDMLENLLFEQFSEDTQ